MKKMLVLTLMLIICISVFEGCSGGESPEEADPKDENTEDSVELSEDSDGGESDEVVIDENYEWWEDDWYGWWCIKNGTGIYEPASDVAWDAYAEIEVYNDNTGFVKVWDTGTSKDEPLVCGYDIVYGPGVSWQGCMVSSRIEFFPAGYWNNGMEADTMDERSNRWIVDPGESSVSHFENMLEITGHYVSPEKPEDSFDYSIYLRPWGTLWDDVRDGDTSGCIYSNMMPLYYDNWYLSLLNLGFEKPTSSFDEGIRIIEEAIAGGNTGGTLDPEAKEGADGKVDMATLKAALEWCKAEASYDTPYDVIAAQFGVHGKQEESLFENNTIYRWWATEDAYVKITFTVRADGTELWNVTQYNGIN